MLQNTIVLVAVLVVVVEVMSDETDRSALSQSDHTTLENDLHYTASSSIFGFEAYVAYNLLASQLNRCLSFCRSCRSMPDLQTLRLDN